LSFAADAAFWSIYLTRNRETGNYELCESLFTAKDLFSLFNVYTRKDFLYLGYCKRFLVLACTFTLLKRNSIPSDSLGNKLIRVLFAVWALSGFSDQFHAHFAISSLVYAYLLESSHYELFKLLQDVGVLHVYHSVMPLALLLCVVASAAANTMRHCPEVRVVYSSSYILVNCLTALSTTTRLSILNYYFSLSLGFFLSENAELECFYSVVLEVLLHLSISIYILFV
jgi:hypothetical protein